MEARIQDHNLLSSCAFGPFTYVCYENCMYDNSNMVDRMWFHQIKFHIFKVASLSLTEQWSSIYMKTAWNKVRKSLTK